MGNVRRVILYKHGVGYFERSQPIEGDAEVRLEFKLEEMNDVLKSLTVHDSAGTVASVSYDSHKPVARLLEEIAIELPASGGASAILARLRGAAVEVESQGRKISGSILGLDQRPLRGVDKPVQESLLSLWTESGSMLNLPLAEIQSVELLDSSLRADLDYCLSTLLRSYKRDSKQLSVFTRGEGRRELHISYMVEAPAWKSSYRLHLSPETALWEGWALIDNPRDEDWEDIELTLVAGLPVSFRHDLYSPRYVQRREVEVESEASVGPVVPVAAMAAGFAGGGLRKERRVADLDLADEELERGGPGSRARSQARPRPAEVVVQSLGEMFHYRVDHPVTVKRNQSALVPIVSHEARAEKVIFYNREQREGNPFAAVDLKNVTGLTLEGGPLLVVEEGSYAGEAMLDTLKPEERRLVPYAVDLAVRVQVDEEFRHEPVHLVRVVRGHMQQYSALLNSTVYRLHNHEERNKICWLEHPLLAGWELYDTEPEAERTDQHHRFRFELEGRSTREFRVTLRSVQCESTSLLTMTSEQIDVHRQGRFFEAGARAALDAVHTAQLRHQENMQAVDHCRQEIQRETGEVERAQTSLTRLGQSSDELRLRSRYVQAIEAGENRLAELQRQLPQLVGAREQTLVALQQAVTAIDFEKAL